MTIDGLHREITSRLRTALGEREGAATARILMEDVLKVKPSDLVLYPDRIVEPETERIIERMVERILLGEPVQYVVGYTRFMGLTLAVSSHTLIPRPETAGLVDMIVDDYRRVSDLRILDIGTGSGCIAIALARALPFARIEAVDVSENALSVARANAKRANVKIVFSQCDILQPDELGQYDIIVSNPPYVTESEKRTMDGRVINYEPHIALFVPDKDPLLFYNAIAAFALSHLNPRGHLYFEINEHYPEAVRHLLSSHFADVSVTRDFTGRYRYAKAKQL